MIILGNIVALIASFFMVYAGSQKKKSKMLLFQCFELSLYTISNIILGGIPGAIINASGIVGNVLAYKNKLNVVVKIILSVIISVLVIVFNNLGIYGYIPLICMISYLWILDIKDVFKFKALIIIIMVLWGIYDFNIKSYVSVTFDTLTIIATIISMIQIKKGKKKKKK